MTGRYQRVRAVFLAALDLEPEARPGYVAEQAGDDAGLRDEVMSLLDHSGAPLLRDAEPARPDPLAAAGAVIDDRYRVVELVDEGGFSFVYRGEHLRWQRPLALKFFKEQRSGPRAALAQAFIKEGALLGELSRRTTTVVQSFDTGIWSWHGTDWLYTALEWLDGETLARRLAREREAGHGGWTVDQVMDTLDPIADALAIATDLGIAHRDFKPNNVFMATVGDRIVPKLIDFGTAKVAASRRGFHAASSVVGVFTVAYAAPEQVVRALGPTGPWTDVYALALVCVELLLGRPPLAGQDAAALIRRIQGREPVDPTRLGLTVAPAVDEVLTRALVSDPTARYPDVRQFWAALRGATAPPG